MKHWIRTHWKGLCLCSLMLLYYGSTAQTLQTFKDQDYPQDIYQLRAMAVRNRTDIDNMERRLESLETNGYSIIQSNVTRISVLEQQVQQLRRDDEQQRTVITAIITFGVANLATLIFLLVRYFMDRSSHNDEHHAT